MALSADHRDDVIDVVVGRLGRPDVALRVAWDDRAAMLHLLSRLDESHELKARAQKRADELLFAAADKPDAGAATLAEAAYLALGRGERAAAIQFFRRATAIEYSALDWRIDLARAYATEGRRTEAVGELHIILGQSPAHAGATALLAQLNAPATQPRHPVPATATTVPTTTPAGFRFD